MPTIAHPERFHRSSAAPQLPHPAALPLRDYQYEALASSAAAEQRGVRRQLVALPTGTGKTVVFSHQLRQRGGRSLVLAHRDELIGQAHDKLLLVDPTADVGRVKAELDEHDRQIVLASVQTLSRPARLKRLTLPFETVIVDEAHHGNAETYRRILDHVGSFSGDGPLTLGFTATPERADGQPLGDVWQEIVYQRGILEMIEAGYLVDLRALQVRLDLDFGDLHTRAGDYITSELEEVLAEADAPEHTAEAYGEHAAGRRALVFTPTVRLAHDTAAAFRERGFVAEALDGRTPAEERRGVLARLSSGETPVVVNCAVLTEGFDESSIDCVIIARPTRSRPLYIQMIGRGTRLHPGKEDCLLLDLVGATTRHDLITTASLFGLSPAEMAEQTVSEAVEARAAAEREQAARTAAAGRLVAETVDLFHRRPLHWVHASGGRFVLSLGDGHLVLSPTDEARTTWRITELRRGLGAQVLADGLPLTWAQGRGEDLARARGAGALVDPNAAWRRRPASPKQRELLRRNRMPHAVDITAGDASDMLSARFAALAVRP